MTATSKRKSVGREARLFWLVRTAPILELTSIVLYREGDDWYSYPERPLFSAEMGRADRHLKGDGYGDTPKEAWALALKNADENIVRAQKSLAYANDLHDCVQQEALDFDAACPGASTGEGQR